MKRGDAPLGPSVRLLKVGEAMRHVLADLLARGEARDPDLEGAIISVSEVRVSPDLRHATAFVMPVGGDEAAQAKVLKALNRVSKSLKGEVARRVNTKYAAELHFRLDESYAVGGKIDALLRDPRVARDLAEGG
ncbi:30S ribosome-binding factor RbfA [Sandaracinobacteroides saxicola]|uniref:Ribosome-binding factor A n=1 Tax=Sandaracinobacteroides saxicola TaxID=2759707 RepID=A0A7G5IF47_9SPHN|nr:30S ribosome-binding factor RbfA [Sandaracinobacteroides saxicola]QMW21989.1 30S ribosome-binding factor RbfA [Sandaracinobacteroides saxicola]